MCIRDSNNTTHKPTPNARHGRDSLVQDSNSSSPNSRLQVIGDNA